MFFHKNFRILAHEHFLKTLDFWSTEGSDSHDHVAKGLLEYVLSIDRMYSLGLVQTTSTPKLFR